MDASARRAEAFRALHHRSRILVLPNAWDVASARAFEEAGFLAVATSSAGLMVSRGYPDGEEMPLGELTDAVERIASRLRIPLSADIVGGYGRTPRVVVTTVRKILAAGAIGINLEDHDPQLGGLHPTASQVAKLRAIRRAAESDGTPLVINARTDALRHGKGNEAARFRQAIERSIEYRDAGADCVYPMGLTEGPAISEFVDRLRCPVNVMIRKGLPPIAELERLGVRRVSFGPGASYATMGLLARISAEVQVRGTYHSLVDGAITFDELNRLAVARPRSAARHRGTHGR